MTILKHTICGASSASLLAIVIGKPFVARVRASPTGMLLAKRLSSGIGIPACLTVAAATATALIADGCQCWGSQANLVIVVIHAVSDAIILTTVQ